MQIQRSFSIHYLKHPKLKYLNVLHYKPKEDYSSFNLSNFYFKNLEVLALDYWFTDSELMGQIDFLDKYKKLKFFQFITLEEEFDHKINNYALMDITPYEIHGNGPYYGYTDAFLEKVKIKSSRTRFILERK